MKFEIHKSFEKDAAKLPAQTKLHLATIIESFDSIKKLSELNSCKKLSGFKNAYRLRLGNYRIGFFFENETIFLVRILSRKDIYKFFP